MLDSQRMKKPAKKKTHFTVAEAAKKLGISRQAVHDAITKGLLRARWGEIRTKALLISAESLKSYRPSARHQTAGKKIADA